MLRGELALEQLRTVTAHLRTCEPCRRELVELAAGAATTARAARHGLVDRVPTPLPPLRVPADEAADVTPVAATPAPGPRADARRRARWLAPVAAAVAAVVALVVVVQVRDGSPDRAPAPLALGAIGNARAEGTVSMRDAGDHQVMVVSTNLLPAERGHYYEVWLLDTETNGMVAVGVLPDSGRGEYTLPRDLVSRYDAIDLSLQPDNGSTVHSSDSVLRAQYA
jgi:hypothetical protein